MTAGRKVSSSSSLKKKSNTEQYFLGRTARVKLKNYSWLKSHGMGISELDDPGGPCWLKNCVLMKLLA